MDPLIGQIQLFPYNFVPRGWLGCNGQLVSVQEFNTLFALLGTKYGGDGYTTFGLPNLVITSYSIHYTKLYESPCIQAGKSAERIQGLFAWAICESRKA